jgi:hypothetical protein
MSDGFVSQYLILVSVAERKPVKKISIWAMRKTTSFLYNMRIKTDFR